MIFSSTTSVNVLSVRIETGADKQGKYLNIFAQNDLKEDVELRLRLLDDCTITTVPVAVEPLTESLSPST